MRRPYQCVVAIGPTPRNSTSSFHLLAACGPKLLLLTLDEGEIVSEWDSTDAIAEIPEDDEDGGGERPKKKQKTAAQVKPANIIKITVSCDQQYVVAVTDDKCVRVFSLLDDELCELSQRCMPKRPCAIQVLPDNTTIVCGDKFGDVYSLPLLPEAAMEPGAEPGVATQTTPEVEGKQTFKPSATNLTVHTQRNRKSLEAQMAQKAFSAKKEPLKFERKVLLGHVSMLTDVVHATRNIDGRERGYMITADRDEHIRISRGPPQSHIIEGYCLGHKEFVSKLCIVPGTDLLVSGGGENELYVWDWAAFTLKRTISLSDAALSMRVTDVNELLQPDRKDSIRSPSSAKKDMAVSGLWIVPCRGQGDEKDMALLVAVECMPGLHVLPTSRLRKTGGIESDLTLLKLDHPPIDVACIGDSFVVTLDARGEGQDRIRAYKIRHAGGQMHAWRVECMRDEELEEKLRCINTYAATDTGAEAKALDGLLYGVANLRKRRGWVEPDKAGDDDPEGEARVEDLAED
ncbi:tRNA (guanine-N(7)-)-methyltransferase non-catalytic subunit trm82 [Friedmanniomyces endolithicus]|uniref:tRNA (Guanine-N(7)-)-methyltransferase non-catalytic subunit trm82 n=1 Tax=Friedmanniomyces endolithicus TaxID=329885 RepID=A0AAN6KKF2_9PEZI|nr:tRNA (guanine-N(7)-)-methyltransferase non-catalytic subunit trm82 [Friedmanniomyces endolithicus]KAK0987177.1 tRNA (guanine-N(7)-)-methyltransferase non-catalytic subunit trm82 [Friedmanniomyces endolithicus]KAK0993479.1 tRNA (guanine-N(7)-)-methyltransferase non-catalytic subunit trm82 [Friedmanniomyces endolithicus]KAK1051240.1 tRNA (guanine-N(7)-)-methyltransferase non-catalytic subunit trm82 [Friedmanniomyces endolithicus]